MKAMRSTLAIAALLAGMATFSTPVAAEAADNAASKPATKSAQVLELDWEELVPESERGQLAGGASARAGRQRRRR